MVSRLIANTVNTEHHKLSENLVLESCAPKGDKFLFIHKLTAIYELTLIPFGMQLEEYHYVGVFFW